MHDNSFITAIIYLCLGLLFLTAVRHYSRNSFFPAEIWLLVSGMMYGTFARITEYAYLPKINLSPDLVLFGLLPLLIFASGRLIKPQTLKEESVPVGLYAVGGVIATACLTGLPLSYVLDLPLLHAMLFGSAFAATDPIAVGAIFKRFKMPEKLDLIVEGESLFNDGTTVVLFHLMAALAIWGVGFNLQESGLTFVWAVLAAFPLGWLLGWIAAKILVLWHEYHPFFPVTMTIVLALFAYVLAEHFLHISGVITVLIASITFVRNHCQCGSEKGHEDAKTFNSFWEYIAILANGFLFFVLGAQTGSHVFGLTFSAVVLSILVLWASRSIVIYTGGGLLKLLDHKLPLSWLHVLNIGGLRGAVSAALILTLPHDYVHRETFLCLGFTLVAASLILQPIAMQLYLKKARL